MAYQELPWVKFMRDHNNKVKEIPGTRHNPTIIGWLQEMSNYSLASKSWWKDDETAWCGLAVGIAMGRTNRFVVRDWFRARAWADSNSMTQLTRPAYGAIVVFSRTGGGHVGIIGGKDQAGNLMVWGGNQGNNLNCKPFSKSRVLGYYWPSLWDSHTRKPIKKVPAAHRYDLPLVKSDGRLSTNEA